MDTFTLGGFTLDAWSMPSRIKIPAAHKYTKQLDIGGDRAIDAMGPDPKPITWKGRAHGQNAASSMVSIKAMCDAGSEVTLSFGQFSFQVFIAEFSFEYMRTNECEYDISVEIVNDHSSGSGAIASSLDALVGGDLGQLQGMISSVVPPVIANAVGAVATAVTAAGTLQGAAAAIIAPVASATLALNQAISGQIPITDTLINAIPSSLASGANAAQAASYLMGQIGSVQTQAAQLAMQGFASRIAMNLSGL